MEQPVGSARVIRVFGSSPGDRGNERAILDEVVGRINRTQNAVIPAQVVLFKWEDSIVPQISRLLPASAIGVSPTLLLLPTGTAGVSPALFRVTVPDAHFYRAMMVENLRAAAALRSAQLAYAKRKRLSTNGGLRAELPVFRRRSCAAPGTRIPVSTRRGVPAWASAPSISVPPTSRSSGLGAALIPRGRPSRLPRSE